MLADFLKSSHPGFSVSWQEVITGVQVCQFSQKSSDGTVPVSLLCRCEANHFEALFCESGTLILYTKKGNSVCVDGRDILLISDRPELRSVQIPADLSGILICIDVKNSREWISSFRSLFGDLAPYKEVLDRRMEQDDGCVLLQGTPWNHSVFSVLQTMPPQSRNLYCILKYIELLYLLSTDNTFLKKQDNLQISSSYLTRTITEMRSFMENHLDEKLTIDSMCRQFYISPTAFKSSFRRMYGVPVHRWLQTRRAEKAAELLRTTSMDIISIAQAVGYEGLSQFNVIFKRQYGMTPRQYRKLSDSVTL